MNPQAGRLSTPSHSVQTGSPAALIAVVPQLLGFVPRFSLVVVGTEPHDGTIKITLRYDLPDPADPQLAREIAEHARAVCEYQQLTVAVAVGYGPEELIIPLAAAFRDTASGEKPGLLDFLRVEDNRYWSLTCTNPVCCPPGGTPCQPADQAAAAAGACRSPVPPARETLAQTIAPLSGDAAEFMRQATRRAEQHLRQIAATAGATARLSTARRQIAGEGLAAVADMIGAYRAGGCYSTDYQVAWLTVALKDIRVRDDAWARMDPRNRDAHRRMWTDLVRRAQPGYVAAPASLLAFVAWQAGNGALANLALDRAIADDPGYSMAGLLRQVISAGAPPSMARLPLTPEEVAACYDEDQVAGEEPQDEGDSDTGEGEDSDTGEK